MDEVGLLQEHLYRKDVEFPQHLLREEVGLLEDNQVGHLEVSSSMAMEPDLA